MDEIYEEIPTRSQFDIRRREDKKKIENINNMASSDQMMEREYYFDEGLGESLNDHVNGLLKEYPDFEIETRRDRDGLAIVKLQMRPKFKYNLDDIMNTDPEKLKKLMMETQEAVVKEFANGDHR